jgi:hypothetical protein
VIDGIAALAQTFDQVSRGLAIVFDDEELHDTVADRRETGFNKVNLVSSLMFS